MQLGVDLGVWEEKEGLSRKWDGCEWLFVFYVNIQQSPGE